MSEPATPADLYLDLMQQYQAGLKSISDQAAVNFAAISAQMQRDLANPLAALPPGSWKDQQTVRAAMAKDTEWAKRIVAEAQAIVGE